MAKIKQTEQVREPVHKRTSQGGTGSQDFHDEQVNEKMF